MYCRNCGKEIHDEAVVCVHCGVATGKSMNTVTDEPASGGLIALSVLVPIAGLILGLVYQSTGKPTAGKTCVKVSVITMAVCAVLYAVLYGIVLAL
ncbi:MAG: zinc ribbon domain-containing protein [Ruminococcus sp.]|nr:zinc ribbon domain-containing protein [Ruminococcus sp.]